MNKEETEELFKLNAIANQGFGSVAEFRRELEAHGPIQPISAKLAPSPEQYLGGHLDQNTEQMKRIVDALDKLEHLERVADAAEEQSESAKIQADAAETQAKLALEQAKKANDTSLLAKLKANKAFILSVIALLVTLLINADKIVANVQKILSYLGMPGH